jgi:aminoglycoside/choline kinase family phosphotransferase
MVATESTHESQAEIETWVRAHLPQAQEVIKLPGDASTRQYFRIHLNDQSSRILMRMESFSSVGNGLDFIVIQKHLAHAKVDVPGILKIDPERGYILLEDLGDITLLRRLQDVSSSEIERHLYEGILDELVKMHVHASPGKAPEIPAYRLLFDHEKLMWEMNFTIEHFYDTYLKREVSPADRETLVSSLSEICHVLASEPRVFTHRDFHSRNVMIASPRPGEDRERLVMIDFQDARLGPIQYDLASLLKDSYYQLEESQVDRLIDYYIVRFEAISGQRIERNHFKKIFDLMSVQRNFKAIGSFASFLNRRQNATYLKYIGNTFENIRRTLLKYPEYENLRRVLFHYYYF